MYDPVKDGVKKNSDAVIYRQAKPPKAVNQVVHSYWQIKTQTSLDDDFILHAIPDACINILFNQKNTDIAGITGLKTAYTELNLGKSFDYAGIQFFPGVWKGGSHEIYNRFVGSKYLGDLPLIEANVNSAQFDFFDKQSVFTDLVLYLIDLEVIGQNIVTQKILANLGSIHTVSDMANVAHLSARQLQRRLKATTGFSPHDFLKVMRFQQSLKQNNLNRYTDQSHFIRSFKKITGYTPTEYYQKYDV